MINKDRNIQKFTVPFPHVIIKNFFTEKFYKEIELNFPKEQNFENKHFKKF